MDFNVTRDDIVNALKKADTSDVDACADLIRPYIDELVIAALAGLAANRAKNINEWPSWFTHGLAALTALAVHEVINWLELTFDWAEPAADAVAKEICKWIRDHVSSELA